MNRLVSPNAIVRSVRLGHWFSGTRKRQSRRLVKPNIPKYTYDWEHERWVGPSLDSHPTVLQQSEMFQKADDEVKRLYSYDFLPRAVRTQDSKAELFEKVGIDAFEPKERDLATHIVHLTFSIRSMKALIEKRHKDTVMRRACATYIGRRKGFLLQLRNQNFERFQKVCSALNIKYENSPFEIKLEGLHLRKAEKRKEYYKFRSKKMSEFMQTLKEEQEQFFDEKEKTLSDLAERLSGINIDLQSLFKEVVEERREEMMQPIRQDEVRWYEREKELKEVLARLEAEKEEKRLKKRRK